MELRERNRAGRGMEGSLPGGSGIGQSFRRTPSRAGAGWLEVLGSQRPLILIALGLIAVILLWFSQMRIEGQSSVKVPANVAELGVIYVGSNLQGAERQRAGLQPQEGLLVTEIKPGGPAAQAGLRAGDWLVEVDGKALKSNDSLLTALSGYRPGDRVQITFVRESERRKVEIILGQLK